MKLTFKFGLLVVLLFFGMLMGMNIAEKGIFRVAGNLASPESFQITQSSNQYEVTVLGKTYTKELIQGNSASPTEEKKKEKEQATTTTKKSGQMAFISKVGNTLGSFVQLGASKGLHFIASFFH